MNVRIRVPWGCFFGGSGGNRSEDGRTEGGVEVVWAVVWDVTAGGGGGCAFPQAGGGGSLLGL